MTIRVLLVDDHPSVREGTKLMLEQEDDILVTLAHCAQAALEILNTERFDVMLFDMNMPDISGTDLARRVLRSIPDATIIIFTGFDFTNHFNLMIESGVSGFVSKTANREQLLAVIRAALQNEVILPLSLVKELRKTSLPAYDPLGTVEEAVTNTEIQILEYISKGKSNKEIAEVVHMSQRSLEYSLTSLFQKLHVKSRIEAVMKARSLGILAEER